MNLDDFLSSYLDNQFPLHSRVHSFENFCNSPSWYVKRDDELSFGISGCKYRKYASLLPFLNRSGYKQVALVGSSYSNHLVGFLQLLNEQSFDYHVFLRQSNDQEIKGNHLLIELLSQASKRSYLTSTQWKEKDTYIPSLCNEKTYYLPEGGACLPSLYGAMTLALDIELNHKKLKIDFDHLFIDAGTGMTAIGLLLGLACFETRPHVHIIQTYDDPKGFQKQLHHYQTTLESKLNKVLALPPFTLRPHSFGKAFGSTPKHIFNTIATLAKQHGILTDPIYSAKLFATCQQLDLDQQLDGNKLIIHSGGGLSLMGFTNQLKDF